MYTRLLSNLGKIPELEEKLIKGAHIMDLASSSGESLIRLATFILCLNIDWKRMFSRFNKIYHFFNGFILNQSENWTQKPLQSLFEKINQYLYLVGLTFYSILRLGFIYSY